MGSEFIKGNSEIELTKNFFNILADDKYRNLTFDELMAEIGKVYDADRTYIFEVDSEKKVWNNTFEWCREGVESQIDKLQNIPLEYAESWIEEFKQSGSFYLVNDEKYAEKEPLIANILAPQGVSSLMAAPLTLQGEVAGFLGVDNPKQNTDKLLLLTIMVISIYKEVIYLRQQKLLETEKENKRKLEKAILEAKKANQAKTAFLSRMSHDIRTPLNGIIGLLELSEKHKDNREFVDANRKKEIVAANHLLSLISDVLVLSKLDSDKIELTNEAFDVDDLSNQIFTMAESRAAESGIELIKLEEDNIRAKQIAVGSPLHLRQIFINIFSNAIKYNKPSGKIYYSREEEYRDDKKVVYRIAVTDTGIGMSEEFLKHIFEPFAQEHYDARSTYHGTGLGMSIVKSLIDKMGGQIDVASKVGEGTTVTIHIPLQLAKSEDLPKKVEISETTLNGINVLIVEDNELNMEIAEAILKDAGAVVTKAFNGEEAVKLFRDNKPGTFDVILMDLMMPVMDGYQATAEIRNYYREDSKTIPIIAVTANAFYEDAKKCLDAGMDCHISKPINIPKLMEAISTATARAKLS